MWHAEDTPQHVSEVLKEYSKQLSQNWADFYIFAYDCCMFNDKIPQQGTTDLRCDMHDSWVFPTTFRGQYCLCIVNSRVYITSMGEHHWLI